MNRDVVLLGAITAVLLVGVGVVVTGSVPLSATNGSATEPTPTGTATASADNPPFTLTTDHIEQCGTTCRDVTLTLTNKQNTTARDVTVRTRIYAGREADGDPVWRDTERVGRLVPNGSVTTTKRVRLTVAEGLSIRSKGGWITLRTTVETAEQTVRFTEQRQVA